MKLETRLYVYSGFIIDYFEPSFTLEEYIERCKDYKLLNGIDELHLLELTINTAEQYVNSIDQVLETHIYSLPCLDMTSDGCVSRPKIAIGVKQRTNGESYIFSEEELLSLIGRHADVITIKIDVSVDYADNGMMKSLPKGNTEYMKKMQENSLISLIGNVHYPTINKDA